MILKNKKIYMFLIGLFILSSCEDYLDIVPDGTQELSLLFNRKETAYNALANCYSYLPKNDGVYSSYVLASDELTTPVDKETNAIKMMKGQLNNSSSLNDGKPIMSYWSGYSANGSGTSSSDIPQSRNNLPCTEPQNWRASINSDGF